MTLGQLLSQGGWAMWPIYLASFVALVVFFQRLFLFQSIRQDHTLWLDKVIAFIRVENYAMALRWCEAQAHPIARVLAQAIKTIHWRPKRVAAEAERIGNLEIDRLERFLPLLAFIAEVAPLLGLLGTVIGMVKMFLALQTSGLADVNASALASGIWQALLTTAAGLIVAAPTLGFYIYLTRKVELFRLQLQDAVMQFITALPYESPPRPPSPNQEQRSDV